MWLKLSLDFFCTLLMCSLTQSISFYNLRSNVCCFAVVFFFSFCVVCFQCAIPFRANLCNVFVGRLGGMAFNTHSWALRCIYSFPPNSNKNNHFAYFFALCTSDVSYVFFNAFAGLFFRSSTTAFFSLFCVHCVNMWVFFSSELNGSLPQVIKTVFFLLC